MSKKQKKLCFLNRFFYAGGAFIKVADSAILTVRISRGGFSQKMLNACALGTGKVPSGCLCWD